MQERDYVKALEKAQKLISDVLVQSGDHFQNLPSPAGDTKQWMGEKLYTAFSALNEALLRGPAEPRCNR